MFWRRRARVQVPVSDGFHVAEAPALQRGIVQALGSDRPAGAAIPAALEVVPGRDRHLALVWRNTIVGFVPADRVDHLAAHLPTGGERAVVDGYVFPEVHRPPRESDDARGVLWRIWVGPLHTIPDEPALPDGSALSDEPTLPDGSALSDEPTVPAQPALPGRSALPDGPAAPDGPEPPAEPEGSAEALGRTEPAGTGTLAGTAWVTGVAVTVDPDGTQRPAGFPPVPSGLDELAVPERTILGVPVNRLRDR